MVRPIALAVLAALHVLAPTASGEPALPRPAALEPQVDFWKRIYTEVDRDGGLIHDSRQMDVVYEVVRFQSGWSQRTRERHVERAKDAVRAALRNLARGKRSGLSDVEAHVLSSWPKGTSNATFRTAASHVRFQLGQADKFRAGLERAGAWRSYIERVLAEHDVPVELAALPHVESSYNPKAYSRVGAAGLWQFTRSTGRRYLRVDHVVDERLDPFLSTIAAARLLRENFRTTGAWPLAITAYNHGAAGMRRAASRLGTTDIAEIVERYSSRTFGFASRNFYTSFLAALAIDHEPERYFGRLRPEKPVDYAKVRIPHYTPMAVLQKAFGLGRDDLHDHNLALRPSIWNGAKYVPRDFELRIPRAALRIPVEQALASIPAQERFAQQHRDRFYKVQRGDALSTIASRYGVRQSELVALNNLRSRHRIRVGQVLILPDDAAGGAVAVARAEPPADGIYRVRRGDTLSRIARRFGIPEAELVAWNAIDDRNRLAVGQHLRVAAPAASAGARAGEPVQIAARTATSDAAPVQIASGAAPASDAAPIQLASSAGPGIEEIEEDFSELGDSAPPFDEPLSELDDSAAPFEEPRAELEDPAAPFDEDPSALGSDEFALLTDANREPEALELEATDPVEPPALESTPVDGVASRDGALVPSPDPSNYAVSRNDRITVQAEETLGHYAEWLELRASQLRRLNGMRYGQPLGIGHTLRLDFSRVTPETFEQRRLAYHQALQDEFFGSWIVTGIEMHTLRRGESLWYLAHRKYRVPTWLLRQYNPDLDFASLPAGAELVVPRVAPRDES